MKRGAAAGSGEFKLVDGGFYFISESPLAFEGVPASGTAVVFTVDGQSEPLSIAFARNDVASAAEVDESTSFRASVANQSIVPKCPKATFTYPSLNKQSSGGHFGSTAYKPGWSHTGIDYGGSGPVIAFADGQIVRVTKTNKNDHALGTTIWILHVSECKSFLSQYSHLASVDSRVKEGKMVKAGMIIGQAGASGKGDLNYWIKQGSAIHLHFEVKDGMVLGNPAGVGTKKLDCTTAERAKNAAPDTCWGYVPGKPTAYGYIDPQTYFKKINQSIKPF
jgi:murein DD-endopeptidase MepM/ murein hydrolase activator NlpD